MTLPESTFRFIGQPMPRTEDARLTTGAGQFSDDFNYPGQAYAVMVRSPYPHARIVRIDKSAVLAMPGVLGVYSGARPASPIPRSCRYGRCAHVGTVSAPWRHRLARDN